MKRLLTTAAIIVLGFTGTSYAAPKMDKANTVKIALYKTTCDSYSERKPITVAVIDDFIDARGGMTKLVYDVAKLNTTIRQNADLDEWCKIMDDQFETMESAVDLKNK